MPPGAQGVHGLGLMAVQALDAHVSKHAGQSRRQRAHRLAECGRFLGEHGVVGDLRGKGRSGEKGGDILVDTSGVFGPAVARLRDGGVGGHGEICFLGKTRGAGAFYL